MLKRRLPIGPLKIMCLKLRHSAIMVLTAEQYWLGYVKQKLMVSIIAHLYRNNLFRLRNKSATNHISREKHYWSEHVKHLCDNPYKCYQRIKARHYIIRYEIKHLKYSSRLLLWWELDSDGDNEVTNCPGLFTTRSYKKRTFLYVRCPIRPETF